MLGGNVTFSYLIIHCKLLIIFVYKCSGVQFKKMQIWDLLTNEKDEVAFVQQKSILPKKLVCGSDHEVKLYFRNIILNSGDFENPN